MDFRVSAPKQASPKYFTKTKPTGNIRAVRQDLCATSVNYEQKQVIRNFVMIQLSVEDIHLRAIVYALGLSNANKPTMCAASKRKKEKKKEKKKKETLAKADCFVLFYIINNSF